MNEDRSNAAALGIIVVLCYAVFAGVMVGRQYEQRMQRELRERRRVAELEARMFRMEHPELFDVKEGASDG